jgi:hypothetical protein
MHLTACRIIFQPFSTRFAEPVSRGIVPTTTLLNHSDSGKNNPRFKWRKMKLNGTEIGLFFKCGTIVRKTPNHRIESPGCFVLGGICVRNLT